MPSSRKLNSLIRFESSREKLIIMRGKILSCIVLCLFACLHNALALGGPQYVETAASKNSFPVVQANSAAGLLADTNDFPGVMIAANNLRADNPSAFPAPC